MEALNKTIANNTQITPSGKEIHVKRIAMIHFSAVKLKMLEVREMKKEIYLLQGNFIWLHGLHTIYVLTSWLHAILFYCKSKTTPNVEDSGMPYKVQCRKEY